MLDEKKLVRYYRAAVRSNRNAMLRDYLKVNIHQQWNAFIWMVEAIKNSSLSGALIHGGIKTFLSGIQKKLEEQKETFYTFQVTQRMQPVVIHGSRRSKFTHA